VNATLALAALDFYVNNILHTTVTVNSTCSS